MRELILDRIQFWLDYYHYKKEQLGGDGISRFRGDKMKLDYDALSDSDLLQWFELFIKKCYSQM